MIKIILIGFCTIICSVLLKDNVSSFSFFVSIFGIIAISYSVVPNINEIYNRCLSYFEILKIDGDLLKPVFKVTMISLMTKITAELCRDRGEKALGFKIELAGVVAGLISSFPLLDRALLMINAI